MHLAEECIAVPNKKLLLQNIATRKVLGVLKPTPSALRAYNREGDRKDGKSTRSRHRFALPTRDTSAHHFHQPMLISAVEGYRWFCGHIQARRRRLPRVGFPSTATESRLLLPPPPLMTPLGTVKKVERRQPASFYPVVRSDASCSVLLGRLRQALPGPYF